MNKKNTGKQPSFLQTALSNVFVQLAAGGGAIAVFWLSPLKDASLHMIYPESVRLIIHTNNATIEQGRPVDIEITGVQDSHLPIEKGVLSIKFNKDFLSLAPGEADSWATDSFSGVTILKQHISLYPTDAIRSEAKISATLETKYGTYESKILTLGFSPKKYSTAPSIDVSEGIAAVDLSGEWHMEIGGMNSTMQIFQDKKDNIIGVYLVLNKNGEKNYKIDGYKDGTSFKTFFHQDDKDERKWRVDANFHTNKNDPRFIEIMGCAYEILRDEKITRDSLAESALQCVKNRDYVGWKGVGVTTFYASARMKKSN